MFRYHQYCPVAPACEILTDRWTLLIVRELLFGSRRFSDLRRGLPRISRSLLVSRLRHLEDNGLIERYMGARPNVPEYVLTDAGNDLAEVIKHLGTWAIKWVFNDPNRDELDPALFLWKMHQRVNDREFPGRRTVVQFDLTGRKGRRVWLTLVRGDVSSSLKPPGFEADLIVRERTFPCCIGCGQVLSITMRRCAAGRSFWKDRRRWFRSSRAGSCGAPSRTLQGSIANNAESALDVSDERNRDRAVRFKNLFSPECVPSIRVHPSR